MNDEATFGGWLAENYPDGGPFRGGYHQDDMEAAFEAGKGAGWDEATDYYARGGSFK